MRLFPLIFMCLSATGAEPIVMYSPSTMPVYREPKPTARKMFFLARGERVLVIRAVGDWTRVRIHRGTRDLEGYVETSRLAAHMTDAPLPDDGWAVGALFLYSRLSQNGKKFTTEDEVSYSTSRYSSETASPYLAFQLQRHDFWRFIIGRRETRFKGTASTDISGAKPQRVELMHSLFSVGFQRAWSPFLFFRPFYMGIGAEMARGTSIKLKLDGVDYPTSEKDRPLYIGLHGLTGLEFFLGRRISVSTELRAGSFLNQSVPVLEVGGGATAFWWF